MRGSSSPLESQSTRSSARCARFGPETTFLLALPLIFLGLTCVVAQAAVAPRLSLESLIDRSPLIVEGRVSRSSVAWDPAHKYIWTHYEITVSDAMRGAGTDVTVSEPGGTLDGVNQRFGGSLPYEPGEHVVLFLFRTPVGYWRTTGGTQGKFAISGDGRIRPVSVGTAISTARVGSNRASESGVRQLNSVDRWKLTEFKSLVRSLARARIAVEAR